MFFSHDYPKKVILNFLSVFLGYLIFVFCQLSKIKSNLCGALWYLKDALAGIFEKYLKSTWCYLFKIQQYLNFFFLKSLLF